MPANAEATHPDLALSDPDPLPDGTPARVPRTWPVAVRAARAADRDQVLAFATATWDGWDYIADIWETWLGDRVGAFLVATVGPTADASTPQDREGRPLQVGQVVAITHLLSLTPTEGWIEGIRVDPRVRGMDVATDLIAAVVAEARGRGMTLLRWATGGDNAGSLRLGARFGLLPVVRWRFHGRQRRDDVPVAAGGRERVEAALARAADSGLLLSPAADGAPTWMGRLEADPTVRAGHGLYEHHAWAQQSLTVDRLAAHIGAGEVCALGPGPDGRWALLIINRATSLEEGELWPALLAGDGQAVVRLLERLGGADGPLARVRLPDHAPLLEGHAADWRRLGYTAHDGTMVVVQGSIAAPTG